MDKTIGKAVRDPLFAWIFGNGFTRSSRHDSPGLTWGFVRENGRRREWIVFQRHKFNNSFTLEIAWTNDPQIEAYYRLPFGSPNEEPPVSGCRFRLGAFWAPEDYWWVVAEPSLPEFPEAMDVEESLEVFMNPKYADLEESLPRIRECVADASRKLEEYAFPYFQKIEESEPL